MTTDTLLLLPMTTPAPVPLPCRRGWLRQLGVDTGYSLIGFPLAIAAFVVVVTALSRRRWSPSCSPGAGPTTPSAP